MSPRKKPAFVVGDLLWAELPVRMPQGHEQHGRRPVVVVGLPESVQSIPYQMVVVVPLTRTTFTGPLFPSIEAGTGGLPAASTALVYQVLALDVVRFVGRLGHLTPAELQPITDGLRQMFGL